MTIRLDVGLCRAHFVALHSGGCWMLVSGDFTFGDGLLLPVVPWVCTAPPLADSTYA